MSKKSELPCKCRLTMPRGGTRATFPAESVEDAQRRALRILKKKALPKGWKLTVDGPAVACYPTPKPAPRPFQVGDRVRRVIGSYCVEKGTLGRVESISSSGSVHVRWDTGDHAYFSVNDHNECWQLKAIEHLEPAQPCANPSAPQPKAEEEDPPASPEVIIQRYRDEVLFLQSEVRELTGNITFKDQEIDRQMAEIATLKAEVERLEKTVGYYKGSAEEALETARESQAKLSDAQAIVRVMEIAKASENPDWDFTTLMAQVVKEPAA